MQAQDIRLLKKIPGIEMHHPIRTGLHRVPSVKAPQPRPQAIGDASRSDP